MDATWHPVTGDDRLQSRFRRRYKKRVAVKSLEMTKPQLNKNTDTPGRKKLLDAWNTQSKAAN